jgi:alpha-D-ribose 1-methylphosphonate 5-triphosphate synthase subunit PhnH
VLDTKSPKHLEMAQGHISLSLCDNESAIRMADNPVEHSRTKHIAIRYHFLRDHEQKGDIEIAYINTKEQLADIFTMPLDEQTFNKLRHELNILDSRNFF